MQAGGMPAGRNEMDRETCIWVQPQKIWLEGIWKKFIVKECRTDAKRTGLLCEILFGKADRTKEELTGQIYLYGSLLREQDLIARQIFLWLLEILEEDPCTEVAK